MDCKYPDDTHLTVAADLLVGRGDIQRNHDKFEKCACVSIIEVQPGKPQDSAPESEQSLVSNQAEGSVNGMQLSQHLKILVDEN